MKYIFGASGHGKVIASALQSIDTKQELVFIDDKPSAPVVFEIPVVSSSEITVYQDKEMIVAVGDNTVRKIIAERLKALFFKVVHPTAVVCKSVRIGAGTVVMPQAVVNADAVIGNHCIVNSGAIVEHDCVLGDFVHLSPNAAIAGGVTIGEGTHIGIGAAVLPNITIGKWAVIGAGTVVLNDVPDYAVVVGNPGKVIKMQRR